MNKLQTLRGFTTISYWADDVVAAKNWYSELLGMKPYFQRSGEEGKLAYVEFRVGDYQHELGLIDRLYEPDGGTPGTGGAVMYWHVDNVTTTLEKLLSIGAKEYESLTHREEGFITASVIDPFGNILGVMYNPHYLEILDSRNQF